MVKFTRFYSVARIATICYCYVFTHKSAIQPTPDELAMILSEEHRIYENKEPDAFGRMLKGYSMTVLDVFVGIDRTHEEGDIVELRSVLKKESEYEPSLGVYKIVKLIEIESHELKSMGMTKFALLRKFDTKFLEDYDRQSRAPS